MVSFGSVVKGYNGLIVGAFAFSVAMLAVAVLVQLMFPNDVLLIPILLFLFNATYTLFVIQISVYVMVVLVLVSFMADLLVGYAAPFVVWILNMFGAVISNVLGVSFDTLTFEQLQTTSYESVMTVAASMFQAAQYEVVQVVKPFWFTIDVTPILANIWLDFMTNLKGWMISAVDLGVTAAMVITPHIKI